MKNSVRPMTGCVTLIVLCLITSATGRATTRSAQDGPVSVNLGDVYRKGEIKIEPYDLATMPPLPPGYAALNNKGSRITTTAVASGPYTIHFSASSVGNEDTFKNLRIFHAEPDPFDPDAPIWVDCTGDSSNAPGPNFSSRTLDSYSEELGVFVIGKLVQKVPPNTAAADLVVTCIGSPNFVTSPDPVTFTVQIENRGPQIATDVGVLDDLSPGSILVSTTPSQGTCKQRGGHVYCKLGTLGVGVSANIVIIVKPHQHIASYPSEEEHFIKNHADARARERDDDFENNHASGSVRVFSDPNLPPSVTITSPKTTPELDATFVGPANITIRATASDPDGTISKVEFFDDGKSIGLGESLDGSSFVITERNVSFGRHFVEAEATDNGGRKSISHGARILVNGTANLSISSPADGAVIIPGSPLAVTAKASHPSGIITKVEFFSSSMSLGEGTNKRGDEYTLRLDSKQRAIYTIVAVATDGSGVKTSSTPVTVKVTKPPLVSIVNPSEGATFPSLYNINITAKASDPDGSIKKVDFYANGLLIGSASDVGTDRFMMTWRRLQDGVHSLTAVATDELGVTSKSDPVKIKVGNPSAKP